MKMNNKMTINLEGVGKAIATAVKREEGKTWYVFDRKIGNSTMNDMDNFLFRWKMNCSSQLGMVSC